MTILVFNFDFPLDISAVVSLDTLDDKFVVYLVIV